MVSLMTIATSGFDRASRGSFWREQADNKSAKTWEPAIRRVPICERDTSCPGPGSHHIYPLLRHFHRCTCPAGPAASLICSGNHLHILYEQDRRHWQFIPAVNACYVAGSHPVIQPTSWCCIWCILLPINSLRSINLKMSHPHWRWTWQAHSLGSTVVRASEVTCSAVDCSRQYICAVGVYQCT